MTHQEKLVVAWFRTAIGWGKSVDQAIRETARGAFSDPYGKGPCRSDETLHSRERRIWAILRAHVGPDDLAYLLAKAYEGRSQARAA
jgi:hypothetical protein